MELFNSKSKETESLETEDKQKELLKAEFNKLLSTTLETEGIVVAYCRRITF